MILKQIFILAIVAFPVLASAQDAILEKIALSLRSSNTKELASLFAANVEITTLKQEGTYSAAQAEQVVKDFFTKYPSKGFELIHKGSTNQGSQYGIGNLTTPKGVFRTYFYLKLQGTQYKIQELRFEEQQ